MTNPGEVLNVVEKTAEKVVKPVAETVKNGAEQISNTELSKMMEGTELKFGQDGKMMVEKVDTTGLTTEEVNAIKLQSGVDAKVGGLTQEVGATKLSIEQQFENLRTQIDATVAEKVTQATGGVSVEQVKTEQPVNMGYAEEQPVDIAAAQEVPASQNIEVKKPASGEQIINAANVVLETYNQQSKAVTQAMNEYYQAEQQYGLDNPVTQEKKKTWDSTVIARSETGEQVSDYMTKFPETKNIFTAPSQNETASAKFPEDKNAPSVQPVIKQETVASTAANLVKVEGAWVNVPNGEEAPATLTAEGAAKKTFDRGIENVDKGPGNASRLFGKISESIRNGCKNAASGFYKLDAKIDKLDGQIIAGLKEELDILAFATQPIRAGAKEAIQGVGNFIKDNVALEEFRPWKMATGESFIKFAGRKAEQVKKYVEKQVALQIALDKAQQERDAAALKAMKDGVKSLFKNLVNFAVGSSQSAIESINLAKRSFFGAMNALKFNRLQNKKDAKIESIQKIEKKLALMGMLDSRILIQPIAGPLAGVGAAVNEALKVEQAASSDKRNTEAVPTDATHVEAPIEQASASEMVTTEQAPADTRKMESIKIPEVVSDEVYNNFVNLPKEKYKVPDSVIADIAQKKNDVVQLTLREEAIKSSYEKEISDILAKKTEAPIQPEQAKNEVQAESINTPANVALETINSEEQKKIDYLKQEIAKMEQNASFASAGDKSRQEKYINEAKAELNEYVRKQNEKSVAAAVEQPAVVQAPDLSKNAEIRNNYNARLEAYRKGNTQTTEAAPVVQEPSRIEQFANEAQFGGYTAEGFQNLTNQANEAKVALEQNNTNA